MSKKGLAHTIIFIKGFLDGIQLTICFSDYYYYFLIDHHLTNFR